MPELPEVEFARSCLSRWLRGQKLVRVEADKTRVVRGTPLKTFATLAKHRITHVERRGKWLLLHFDSELGVLAHLGMTGKFELARKADETVRWSRVRFARADGAVVHYRDPRQFGHLRAAPLSTLLATEPLKSLGPDAKDHPPSASALATRMSKSRRTVKEILMDQTVLAGIGNIQATEALFLARIHPARKADSLAPEEIERIRRGVARSLARTLAMNKGDKIAYVEESKRVENPFLIYGKAGDPCPECGTSIEKMAIGGRTSSFCPHCQPRAGAKREKGSQRPAKLRQPLRAVTNRKTKRTARRKSH